MLKAKCPSCKEKFWDARIEIVDTDWHKWQKYNYYCPACSVQLKIKKSSVIAKIMIFIISLIFLFVIGEYKEHLGYFKYILELLIILLIFFRDEYCIA
jgi:hypothetical protein